MKASSILKKARKLIAEKGHCKGEFAKNKYRHKVEPTNKNAVAYCALGALECVLEIPRKYDSKTTTRRTEVQVVSEYLGRVIPEGSKCGRSWWSVNTYNDYSHITPQDIDDWFGRAIVLAEKENN